MIVRGEEWGGGWKARRGRGRVRDGQSALMDARKQRHDVRTPSARSALGFLFILESPHLDTFTCVQENLAWSCAAALDTRRSGVFLRVRRLQHPSAAGRLRLRLIFGDKSGYLQ